MSLTVADILALKGCSDSPIHYYTCGNLYYVEEPQGTGLSKNQDLGGLEHSLMDDVTCHSEDPHLM